MMVKLMPVVFFSSVSWFRGHFYAVFSGFLGFWLELWVQWFV
jgi:hypothetical protein